jgi:hypothetical protein
VSKEDVHGRRLEGEFSQAARTPLAQHEDALSPAMSLRESAAAGGGQRLGDNGPVANPFIEFPGEEDTSPDDV